MMRNSYIQEFKLFERFTENNTNIFKKQTKIFYQVQYVNTFRFKKTFCEVKNFNNYFKLNIF